jgi:hypothetical protein
MDQPTDDATVQRLVEVFKALADPARLRILGAIADGPLTGKDLSERLGLTPPTISHHMSKLVGAHLVTVTPDAQRRLYTLDAETLRGLSRDVAGRDRTSDGKASVGDRSERDRNKVIKDFFKGQKLKQIPAQRKKRVVVLQHLLARFEPNRDYTEREVNAILKEAYDDVATLRRELVDYGFMTRAGGVYRVAQSLPKRSARVAQEITGDEHRWLRALLSGATSRALTPELPS